MSYILSGDLNHFGLGIVLIAWFDSVVHYQAA